LWTTKESIPSEDGAIYRGNRIQENDSDYVTALKMVGTGVAGGLSPERIAYILRESKKVSPSISMNDDQSPTITLTEEERCDAIISEIKKLASAVNKRVEGFEEYNRVHHYLNVEQRVPKGVKNGQQWVRETLGVSGLEKRLEILQTLLKNNSKKRV
jgi:hypothetical protein